MIDRGEFFRKLALGMARFSGLSPLADRLYGGVGAILMLHRITATAPRPLGVNRHLSVTPCFLDAVLAEMSRLGYRFVSLDEAVERLSSRRDSERFAAITADDAYRDNLEEALPVLEKHGAPMTIYVAPGLVEGTALLWWDILEEIVTARETVYLPTPEGVRAFDCSTPAAKFRANTEIHDYLTTVLPEVEQVSVIRDLARSCGIDAEAPRRETLMSWDEIRRARAHPLLSIGAHTVHHYNLMRLDEDRARREIADSASLIEIETGERPRHFSYPYGYASAVGERETRFAAEAGYASAVTTRHGILQAEHAGHLHALPRLSINGRYQRVPHVRTMLSGITTPIANRGRRVVTV